MFSCLNQLLLLVRRTRYVYAIVFKQHWVPLSVSSTIPCCRSCRSSSVVLKMYQTISLLLLLSSLLSVRAASVRQLTCPLVASEEDTKANIETYDWLFRHVANKSDGLLYQHVTELVERLARPDASAASAQCTPDATFFNVPRLKQIATDMEANLKVAARIFPTYVSFIFIWSSTHNERTDATCLQDAQWLHIEHVGDALFAIVACVCI